MTKTTALIYPIPQINLNKTIREDSNLRLPSFFEDDGPSSFGFAPSFEFAANFAEGDFFELVAVSGLSSFFDRSRIFDDLSENEEI